MARWAFSPFDFASHLVAPGSGGWGSGLRAARCGHVLFRDATECARVPSRPCAFCWVILRAELDVPDARPYDE